jgi:hypothetical protein
MEALDNPWFGLDSVPIGGYDAQWNRRQMIRRKNAARQRKERRAADEAPAEPEPTLAVPPWLAEAEGL